MDPYELLAVQDIKKKFGIDDPAIQSLADLEEYLNKGVGAISNIANNIKKTPDIVKSFNDRKPIEKQWLDGTIDKLQLDQVEFILRQTSDKPTISASDLFKIAKSNNLPIGLLLTFAGYEDLLDYEDGDKAQLKGAIISLANILNKYYWSRDIYSLDGFVTGINDKDKKVTGAYFSKQAEQTIGNGKVSAEESKKYADSQPIGYNQDSNLAEKLTSIYNEFKSYIE